MIIFVPVITYVYFSPVVRSCTYPLLIPSGDGCTNPENGEIDPFQVIYPEDAGGTLKCADDHVLPWAKSEDDTEGDAKCVNDGSGALAWAPDPKVDGFDETVTGCVGKLQCIGHH